MPWRCIGSGCIDPHFLTRNLPDGKERPAGKADNLTVTCEPIVWTMWEPRRLTTSRVSTACFSDSFTFLLRTTKQALAFINGTTFHTYISLLSAVYTGLYNRWKINYILLILRQDLEVAALPSYVYFQLLISWQRRTLRLQIFNWHYLVQYCASLRCHISFVRRKKDLYRFIHVS
jgi:hypothetical protein